MIGFPKIMIFLQWCGYAKNETGLKNAKQGALSN